MNFKSYSKWNNIVGWIVFAIAAFTYLSTMERTVSLWDCGEFVSSAYKLQVPHPPGAPFFLLVYRFFTIFSFGNLQMVPILANAASALCSAFTILFLFWSITALAKRIFIKNENEIVQGDFLAVLSAGVVGALAYTFSDTFWFSAVESEVYAMSSMFTALVFWLVLKWERRANEPYNLRWLVLIFYLVGVVIGVHLLGLLVIPVVFLVYYYKKYPTVTPKGVITALALGFLSLGIVQIFTIQWLPGIGSRIELVFKNDFGLPFWSGIVFFFVLLFGTLGYFIIWSQKRGKVYLNLALTCFTAVLIGYSSYATSVIRSHANPSIDMNDPEDVFSYISYLSREQYGDNYLLTGPYYTAFMQNPATGDYGYTTEPGAMGYRREGNEYIETGEKLKPKFRPEFTTFFPRMFHQEPDKMEGYRFWAFNSLAEAHDAENANFTQGRKLPFSANLRFFFDYQINYMYFRYFAWNFIGRQNDLQGTMKEFHQGNWITGIKPIDEKVTGGDMDNLPKKYAENKAYNKLFGLPFILGLLGMFFHFNRHRKDFWVILLFFFMTGLAIEIYLNMPAFQPRERDYAFVGSFYVFAIWIGLGVLAIYDFLRSRVAARNAAIVSGTLSLVAVPVLMAATEWDDHDRSYRMASLDYGVNYLESCPKNAILFTNGDNDTYPLWYAQEVENIRSDIRIVNLSLFGTDWYINQMRKPINSAPGLTLTMTPKQLADWDYLQVVQGLSRDEIMDYRRVMYMIATDSPQYRATYRTYKGMESTPYLPTKNFRLVVDQEAARKSLPDSMHSRIVPHIDLSFKKNTLTKSDLEVLDLIVTNQWKNPICFSVTSGPDEYLGLMPFLHKEGLIYHLMPVPAGQGFESVNTAVMYENVMKKWRWGKIDQDPTLVDFMLMRQGETMRSHLQSLALALLQKGDKVRAKQVADLAMTKLPAYNIPNDLYSPGFVNVYFSTGESAKGKKLADELYNEFTAELEYYCRQDRDNQAKAQREIYYGLQGYYSLLGMAKTNNNYPELAEKLMPKYGQFVQNYVALTGDDKEFPSLEELKNFK